MRSVLYFTILLCTCFSSTGQTQQLSVSKLFNDYMVLQKDQPIKIWGWAKKGAEVKLVFDETHHTTMANQMGTWMLTLEAMPAGGPHQIMIHSEDEVIKLRDILIGDVWLCSGQSNMEWSIARSNHAKQVLANASDRQIRHCKIPKHYSEQEQDSLVAATWTVSSTATVGDFTAVGYFFAKALREHHQVPIGLLNNAWGGSRIEAWMSAEMLGMKNPTETIEARKEKARAESDKRLSLLKAKFPDLSKQERGIKNGEVLWAAPKLNDDEWANIEVPGLWEEQGYEGFDGIAWYRTTVVLTEKEAQDSIELKLAQIDDSDITWLNGQKIGSTENAWDKVRSYSVDPKYLNSGTNTIAIRVEDTGGGGGIHGKTTQLLVKTKYQTIPLARQWKFKIDAYQPGSNYFAPHQTETLLYNQLIHPITAFPIKGVIWYQGESNANNTEDALAYRNLFKNMIQGWREKWGIGNFPFLFVQLANYKAAQPDPSESDWALLRESQSMTLKEVDNTAQAITIDIGEADDIHPRNKQDVGKRLALAARKLAYEEELVFSGPVYKNHTVEKGRFILNFDHIGTGLKTRNKYGYVLGFAVAGADKKFVWAKARMDGNQIIVGSEKVKKPLYLRYAWADNPANANLYNSAGLPMGPFRIE